MSLVTISTKHYIDLKYAISDSLQRNNWATLFELCRTEDSEISKTIAAIFSLYEPENTWRFIDYVLRLDPEMRLHKWESVSTVCYILGKIAKKNTRKAVESLKIFLAENHMLRPAAIAALSNMWVMNNRVTSDSVYKTWIMKSHGNEDLQEVAVKSCEYLAINEPGMVAGFLKKVSRQNRHKISSEIANDMISKYLALTAQRKVKVKKRKNRKSPNKRK